MTSSNLGSRLSVLEKVFGVVTAILVLVTAYLTYKTASLSNSNSETRSTLDDQSSNVTALQKRVKDLTAQNGQLNAALASALAVPSTSAGGASTTKTPAVRRQGDLIVRTSSQNADLDADPDDPQWGRQADDYDGEIQPYAGDSTIAFPYGLETAKLAASQPPNYLACSNNQTYESTDQYDIGVGDSICVQTTDGRYAALHVRQLSHEQMVLGVTVWNKA